MFGVVGWVGPWNDVLLDGGAVPLQEKPNWGAVQYKYKIQSVTYIALLNKLSRGANKVKRMQQ